MNYKIAAKYIKHIKFEIPNPKTFFLLEKNIANYKINIDIKSNQFKDKIIEIDTSLALNPTTSVIKPGTINNKAAKAIDAPDIIS